MPEIPKTCDTPAIEERWYTYWEEEGCFAADPASAKPPYSIAIPPPNVTGVLTLGHVLNVTIQDILARRARMLGKEVLWLPGTDHAGIATQTVVEKTLKKQGAIKHRDDLGRDAFLEKVWEWKEKHGGIIIQQLRKLGASCDWARERFTMDPAYSDGVQRVFADLFRKGLIYRGKRMVNWDPVSLSALSDEEVTMKAQNGTLYYFEVEVVEQPGTRLTVATTRPETIPGDSGIAVNPEDPRYKHLIGLHARRPLQPAEIPIIGDVRVDFAFGTGVLKVTPAHDKLDFEIGLTHGLEVIDIMHPNGRMNDLAGADLTGLDRFEARKVAVEALRLLGALVKEEPYQNNVGFTERTDVPVEPRLSEQWFLRYPSVAEARDAVASGSTRFHPERWSKVYDHWMEKLQDWCISRQVWWGHRIPVWRPGAEWHADPEQVIGTLKHLQEAQDLFGDAIIVRRTDEAITAVCLAPEAMAAAARLEELGFCQDPDVLDTWFSSWLWPFATMGWPERTATFARFYPTTDLVTGPDIIFFWVARMIMAGLEYTGQTPFANVYFTGIIRDKQGRKMSKSLGNSPDPLDLIARFGADALRFGVMRSAPLGQDILFDEKNVELGRNFCTKLWNAARFRQMHEGEIEGEIEKEFLSTDSKWILLRLDAAILEVSLSLDEYRFSDAANALYRFFWTEFCDWYLEASKAALYGADAPRKACTLAVMDFVLAHTLRLFHPFLPFITEELWHGLGYQADLPADQGGRTILQSHWPTPLGEQFRTHYSLDESDEQFAEAKRTTVDSGRALRRDYNIASNKRVRFVLRPLAPLASGEADVLRLLLNAETLDLVDAAWPAPRGTPVAPTPLGELFLPLEGLIDVPAERERLGKEIAKVEQELATVRRKLASETFVSGAPPAVVAEHRERQAAWEEKLALLSRLRVDLGE